jgi:hypothetical protein
VAFGLSSVVRLMYLPTVLAPFWMFVWEFQTFSGTLFLDAERRDGGKKQMTTNVSGMHVFVGARVD